MKLKQYAILVLYKRFLRDMKSGKRLQANGKKIKEGTLKNYTATLNYLHLFEQHKAKELTVNVYNSLNKKEWAAEKKRWHDFYIDFTGFLYSRGGYDNFVGSQIKQLKVFFKYLELEYGMNTGGFYKKFYVLKEEIDILVLMPDQLKRFIYDKAFEDSLNTRLQLVKDIFVVGATVALRFGDLVNISRTDILRRNELYYLMCKSEKTDTITTIKLPDYVVAIINKYMQKRKRIFPDISLDNFDTLVKVLFEQAGWTDPIQKKRSIRGKPQLLKPLNGRKEFRFCDMATSHMMRRTAITTMLMHGVSETVVRQISGHTKGGKSFYKYVAYVQPYMDLEIDKHFEKMSIKVNVNDN